MKEDENLIKSFSNIMTFNISGTKFQTFRSTLMKKTSLLSKIVSEKIDTKKLKDKEGNIFLNRSPEGFEFILNCLRQNNYQFNLKKTDEKKLKFLKEEIKYYEMDYLIKINEIQQNNKKNKNHYKKRKRGGKSFKTKTKTKKLKFVKNSIPFVVNTAILKRNFLLIDPQFLSSRMNDFVNREDFFLGFLSASFLLCSIQITLNMTGYLNILFPNIFVKYVFGLGSTIYFAQLSYFKYNGILVSIRRDHISLYLIISVAFSIGLFLLEMKIKYHIQSLEFYFLWFWVIYPFSKLHSYSKNNQIHSFDSEFIFGRFRIVYINRRIKKY